MNVYLLLALTLVAFVAIVRAEGDIESKVREGIMESLTDLKEFFSEDPMGQKLAAICKDLRDFFLLAKTKTRSAFKDYVKNPPVQVQCTKTLQSPPYPKPDPTSSTHCLTEVHLTHSFFRSHLHFPKNTLNTRLPPLGAAFQVIRLLNTPPSTNVEQQHSRKQGWTVDSMRTPDIQDTHQFHLHDVYFPQDEPRVYSNK
ncbi:hypothetical protein TcWFU_008811 [Taenia crassiceps]|uniref:Uncharacterized protein n=1 Tax=Taenia crassiceps TaxID=6207 RepID=A0ABR4Q551_9CEST